MDWYLFHLIFLITVFFLELLLEAAKKMPFARSIIEHMDKIYAFGQSKNYDVRFYWYKLCLACGSERIIDSVVQFLREQGRLKYVLSLYQELGKTERGLFFIFYFYFLFLFFIFYFLFFILLYFSPVCTQLFYF
jgi:hypothetical protein